jgi:hypothetical protein
VYVLHNARHHGIPVSGADEWSSGPWFDGWTRNSAVARPFPCAPASTWLLREGWRRHGLIGIDESPRPVVMRGSGTLSAGTGARKQGGAP